MISALTVLAAGEASEGEFHAYEAALFISGALLVLVAVLPFLRQPIGIRVLNGLIGVAMLSYGFYLAFIFDGGTFFESYYVFIVPILLIINVVKQARANKQNA